MKITIFVLTISLFMFSSNTYADIFDSLKDIGNKATELLGKGKTKVDQNKQKPIPPKKPTQKPDNKKKEVKK